MADVVHHGDRSWWSGQVRTLCGLVLDPDAERVYFATVTCPACRTELGRTP
ncbi:hypothetical protein [Amycolatopsis antarctica]|uniref:hypothetical protein n=1 Tax=Amycolatopsis antarctica TaxID=1854586 RepID=UPI0013FDB64D|nr:hypothetical protein [Amycolatopsis antarctica]